MKTDYVNVSRIRTIYCCDRSEVEFILAKPVRFCAIEFMLREFERTGFDYFNRSFDVVVPAIPTKQETTGHDQVHIVREETIVKAPPRYPPKLVVVPAASQLHSGDQLRLRAVADASPPARFTWFWNGFE